MRLEVRYWFQKAGKGTALEYRLAVVRLLSYVATNVRRSGRLPANAMELIRTGHMTVTSVSSRSMVSFYPEGAGRQEFSSHGIGRSLEIWGAGRERSRQAGYPFSVSNNVGLCMIVV